MHRGRIAASLLLLLLLLLPLPRSGGGSEPGGRPVEVGDVGHRLEQAPEVGLDKLVRGQAAGPVQVGHALDAAGVQEQVPRRRLAPQKDGRPHVLVLAQAAGVAAEAPRGARLGGGLEPRRWQNEDGGEGQVAAQQTPTAKGRMRVSAHEPAEGHRGKRC